MLSKFRKMTKYVIWFVVIAFVGTIIFAWGMDVTRSKSQKNIIGTVDGHDFEYRDYQPYYESLYNQVQQQQQGGELDYATLRNMRRQAWENLVNDYLFKKAINKFDITVTDEDVVNFLRYQPPAELQQAPAFQTNGQFDYQKYLAAMSDNNPQTVNFWAQVEAYYRPQLGRLKLQELITSTVRVSEQDVRDAYMRNFESADIKIAYCNVNKFRDQFIDVTDEQIQAYYDEHKDEYEVGERSEIKFVRFSKDPTEADWERLKAEMDFIKSRIDEGEDFGEMAQAYSEDGSAQNGGDLGWFGHGRMVSAFDSAAFSLKVGEVSDPVKTDFGWHIIKVTDQRTQNGEKEIKASHILLKIKASSETLDEAYRKAESVARDAIDMGFDEAAKLQDAEVFNSGQFQQNARIEEIGVSPEVSDFAFKNEPGTISGIIETNSHYVVAQVLAHYPAGPAPMEMITDAVKRDLIISLAKVPCKEKVDHVYAEALKGVDFDKAAKSQDVDVVERKGYTRGGLITGIGNVPEVAGTVFSLKDPGSISAPFEYVRGWAIVKLLNSSGADLSKYADIRDSLELSMLREQQQKVFNAWFEHLRESANIEQNLDEVLGSR